MSWGGVRLIDWIYPVGHIIASSNPEFDPNLIYRTTTWERYAAGKTLVGVDDTDDEFNSIGKIGGEKTHELTINEMPNHNHNVIETRNSSNVYSSSKTVNSSGEYYVRRFTNASNGYLDSVSDNDTYRMATSLIGGSTAHNNMPPYITVYFWRRTA